MLVWSSASQRPCVVCIADEDRQELFNWTATFHRDLSPLTSWCHVLSPKEIGRIAGSGRSEANLFGVEAAWAGAAIAEAIILARRNYESISLPVCLATDTFAIARTASLYGARAAISGTVEQLDNVRSRFKKPMERWRPVLAMSVLVRLLPDSPSTASWIQEVLLSACRNIVTHSGEEENPFPADVFREIRENIPQLSILESLGLRPAEQRVRILREMPTWILNAKNDDVRQVLQFVAGYIISRIGGAERDLRLAEAFENSYPNVLTWAAVTGGLGVTTYWSDAFGGIGRLVARELSRSVDYLDAPTSDIASDELLVIAAQDGVATRFRTALRHVATISFRPGVVVQLSLADEERSTRVESRQNTAPGIRAPGAPPNLPNDSRQLQQLAETLFPYLRPLMLAAGFEAKLGKEDRTRRGRPPQLPLT